MILNPRKYPEFNELFAKYLGWSYNGNRYFKASYKDIAGSGSQVVKTLHFHDRWEWLMKVYEKILKEEGYDLHLYGSKCAMLDGNYDSSEENTLILNVYNCLYQFLKGYYAK